jgi:hypothetical protein
MPDDPFLKRGQEKGFAAGFVLADVLRQTGGTYQTTAAVSLTLASRSASYFQTALACFAWDQPRSSGSNTACCQHCCQVPGQPSTGGDGCGISAQPTTSNGRS